MKLFFGRLLFTTLVFAGLWLAGLVAFVQVIPSHHNPESAPTDAVIVLTGGPGRIDTGIRRLAEGKAQVLFISGVGAHASEDEILNLKDRRRFPNMQIELGHEATSTIGNAVETTQWVVNRGVQSIRLVTAAYHMPRSILEFKQVMPADIAIIADPMFPEGFRKDHWWKPGFSQTIIISEYHKIILAALRHQLLKFEKHQTNKGRANAS